MDETPIKTQETKLETTGEQYSPFLIPGAIVVAGALIAGALFFTDAPVLGTPSTPAELGEALYVKIAKDLRLPADDFAACLSEKRHEARVQNDFDNALASGGNGTPFTIVINAQGKKFPVSGSIKYAQLSALITEALKNESAFGNSDSLAAENMRPVGVDDHVRGDRSAPVMLVEYSDFECPFCAQFHPTLEKALDDFDGQVAWTYRHFPLTSIHAEALPAALASECAAELGGEDAFWDFADSLFTR